ncbi:MAG: hypothetical protein WKG00_28320 [Polyangiaceae bacterium]
MPRARWLMTVVLLGAGAALAGACAQGGQSTDGMGSVGSEEDEGETFVPGDSSGDDSGGSGDPTGHGTSGADGSSGEADDGPTSAATSGGATSGGTTSGGTTSGAATTGGTSAASSGGDPVGSCNGGGDCNGCFDCAVASDCAADVDACMNNQACADVDECVYQCGSDDLCYQSCLQMPGGPQWLDVGGCIFCYACPDSCPDEAQDCY